MKPTVNTEWASDTGALKSPTTQTEKDFGWSTSDNTVGGVPVRPNIEIQNWWQNLVYQWIVYLEERADNGVLPLGTVYPIFDNLSGSISIPPSGVVNSAGFQLCDGAAIPAGNLLTGNVPQLTNDVFLRAANATGNVGNGEFTLTDNEMPSHSHSSGSYQTQLSGGPWTTSGHVHNSGSLVVNYGASNSQSPGPPSGDFPNRYSTAFAGGGFVANRITDLVPGGGPYFDNFPDSTSSRGIDVRGFSGPPSSTVSLTGSTSLGGSTSSTTGGNQPFNVIPKYIDVVYLIKVN